MMENQNVEFKAVIKFLTVEGSNAKENHRRMAEVYGDSDPAYSTVTQWSAEFKRGKFRITSYNVCYTKLLRVKCHTP